MWRHLWVPPYHNNFLTSDHRRTVSYIVDDSRTEIQHQRSLSQHQQHQIHHQQIPPNVDPRPPALPPKVGGSSTAIYRPSEMNSSIYRSSESNSSNAIHRTNEANNAIYRTPEAKSEEDLLSRPREQFSFLQQLVQSSPNPELLDTLRRHQVIYFCFYPHITRLICLPTNAVSFNNSRAKKPKLRIGFASKWPGLSNPYNHFKCKL